MARLSPDAAVEKMSAWLKDALGPRLKSLVLYGSVVSGNHHHRYSDINLLVVLDQVDGAVLDQAAEAIRWWASEGNPPPVIVSAAEQADAADVFSVEYLDIHNRHRVLAGEDLFAAPPLDRRLHRLQVEHDLRTHLISLRGHYGLQSADRGEMESLIKSSISGVLTLFRHALLAVGEPWKDSKADALAAAAVRFQFSPAPFERIIESRKANSRLGNSMELKSLFSEYMAAIQKVERVLEESDDH